MCDSLHAVLDDCIVVSNYHEPLELELNSAWVVVLQVQGWAPRGILVTTVSIHKEILTSNGHLKHLQQ